MAKPMCHACGLENSPGARFCARCLRSLELGKEMVKVQSRRALERRLDTLEKKAAMVDDVNVALIQLAKAVNPRITEMLSEGEDSSVSSAFWKTLQESLAEEAKKRARIDIAREG